MCAWGKFKVKQDNAESPRLFWNEIVSVQQNESDYAIPGMR